MSESNKNTNETPGVPATVEIASDIVDLSNKNMLDLSNLNSSAVELIEVVEDLQRYSGLIGRSRLVKIVDVWFTNDNATFKYKPFDSA